MKLPTVILGLLVSGTTYAYNPSEIPKVIKSLTPSLDTTTALVYANIISRYSKLYELDWKLLVAILKQESNFELGCVSDDFKDFGIGQLNYRTIQSRRLNLGKLLTDPDYAIGETARLLAELKRKYYSKRDTGYYQWFTRYHSFTSTTRYRYWHGVKPGGRDGLKYKLDAIDELINGKQKPTHSASKELERVIGTPASRTEEKTQERLSCGKNACPVRRRIRSKPKQPKILGS